MCINWIALMVCLIGMTINCEDMNLLVFNGFLAIISAIFLIVSLK